MPVKHIFYDYQFWFLISGMRTYKHFKVTRENPSGFVCFSINFFRTLSFHNLAHFDCFQLLNFIEITPPLLFLFMFH